MPKNMPKKQEVVEEVATKETSKTTKAKVTKPVKEVKEKKVVVKKETTKKAIKKVEDTPVDEVVVDTAEKVVVETESKTGAKSGRITVEQLFEAGAHFGHVVKKWNPKMKKYIWGQKSGVHVFDLQKTTELIEDACKAIAEFAESGKKIVWVGTKRQAKLIISDLAEKEGLLFLTQRWMGGLLTNWRQIKLSIDRLNTLKIRRDKGELKKFTKKEQVLFDREIQKLERVLGGISSLKEAPEVLVVIDTHKERLAVREARLKGIKVIGIIDTNADPDMVDYPIPMNDDSAKSLELVINALVNATKEAKKDNK
jgi:small subunit ribosomal protein S2